MIIGHLPVAIDSAENTYDILWPMDTRVRRASLFRRPIELGSVAVGATFSLGSILTFSFRSGQRVHLLVCYDEEAGTPAALVLNYLELGLNRLAGAKRSRRYSVLHPARWSMDGMAGLSPSDIARVMRASSLALHTCEPAEWFASQSDSDQAPLSLVCHVPPVGEPSKVAA